MGKTRLEAFSDGVLAIILTIMVLELKVPSGQDLSALLPLWPALVAYILSFIYIGIYWNNHHHLFHAVTKISGGILWANLHLLFWLSLIPVTTAWLGQYPLAPWPAALYGSVLLGAGIAHYSLVHLLMRHQGDHSPLARAIGRDIKGRVSLFFYLAGMGCAFLNTVLACLFYLAVAIMWFVPDRRLEPDQNQVNQPPSP